MLVKLTFFCGIVLVLLPLYGCGSGVQTGAFTVAKGQTTALRNVQGEFTILRGDANPPSANRTGDTPLIYYLVINPWTGATGGGSGGSDLDCVSTYYWKWITKGGEKRVEASWNRCAGTVVIGGQTFDYKNGNAFVLVQDAMEKVTAQQFGPFHGKVTEAEALRKFTNALPEGHPARNAKLMTDGNE